MVLEMPRRLRAGDEINFLAKAKGIDLKEATKEFLRMAGVIGENGSEPPSAPKQAEGTGVKPAPVKPRPLRELLDIICIILRHYVVFQLQEQVKVCALWIAHTRVMDAFDFMPYLHVFSAEKRSEKSRLLDVLELLVKGPWRDGLD